MLKIGGLPLTYKEVFKYCARAFRWGWVLKLLKQNADSTGGGSPKLGINVNVLLEPSLSCVTRNSACLWLSELCVQQRREVAKLYQNFIFHHPQTFLSSSQCIFYSLVHLVSSIVHIQNCSLLIGFSLVSSE